MATDCPKTRRRVPPSVPTACEEPSNAEFLSWRAGEGTPHMTTDHMDQYTDPEIPASAKRRHHSARYMAGTLAIYARLPGT